LRHLDAVNIGAAGTFVIRGKVTRARLRAEVMRVLPFDAEVMVCDGGEIARLVAREPFAGLRARRDVVRFVSVLSRQPRRRPELPLDLPRAGRWIVKVLEREGRLVVGMHRREMKAIRCLGQLDELFGVSATTRSWNTLLAIEQIARSLATPSQTAQKAGAR
jgi:uncharacterized protein (DUF1697 family)